MDTKSLLIGIISFIAGGLVVSTAAVTINKEDTSTNKSEKMSMNDMSGSMYRKTGDDFDKAFLSSMIVHHEGAIEMAEMAQNQAKHDEIKQLSKDIISAQQKEITQMREWQNTWSYDTTDGSMMD